jgi:hypothetical protein
VLNSRWDSVWVSESVVLAHFFVVKKLGENTFSQTLLEESDLL